MHGQRDEWAAHARPTSALGPGPHEGIEQQIRDCFGGLLGLLGVAAFVCVCGLLVYNQWRADDMDGEAWMGVIFLPVMLATVIRGWFGQLSHRLMLGHLRMYGSAIPATITGVSRGDRDSPHIYEYEYWIRGRVESGSFAGEDRAQLSPGDRIVVLASGRKRNYSAVVAPDYYTTSAWFRERVTLRKEREAGPSLEAEEVEVEAEEKVAEAQPVGQSW